MPTRINFSEYSKLQLEAWKGVLAKIDKLEQEIKEVKDALIYVNNEIVFNDIERKRKQEQ